jgi:hypothetical protein
MTDLTDLLDRVVDLDDNTVDARADLVRARTAWQRRRRVRSLAAAGSLVAVGVLAVGVAGSGVLDRAPQDDSVVVDPGADKHGSITLLAAALEAGPYTFGKVPEGWTVQGTTPSAVTIAQQGDDDGNPDSFVGKLVILYDQNPPSGEPSVVNGRTFFTRGDSGHTTISVATEAGQPVGQVMVQFPDSAGWSHDTMIEFLDAVQVNASAQPGLG